MTKTRCSLRRRALAATLVSLALPLASLAHEGHDDNGPAPALPVHGLSGPRFAATSDRFELVGALGGRRLTSGPRFAATSDRFELVGALGGRRLTLWLDRFGDNAPVIGAQIELEVGDDRLAVQPVDEAYVAELPAPPVPGTLPVTATIMAGPASDLLAAELVIPAPAAAAPAAASPARAGSDGLAAVARLVVPAGLVAIAAGMLGWAAARRRGRA